MKKLLSIVFAIIGTISVNAQEEGKFRVGLDFGGVFSQEGEEPKDLLLMRPTIVIVSDVPGNEMSIRSCAGHIATMVTKEFAIKPQRMMWIEYYPEQKYGQKDDHTIPEKYDAVEFLWKKDKAVEPKWRILKPPLLEQVIELMKGSRGSLI